MKRHNSKGFTLLEMMVVVAIVAVLLAVALISFRNFQTSQFDADAYTLTLKALREARQLSIDKMIAVTATFQSPGTIAIQQQTPACAVGSSGCSSTPGTGSYQTVNTVTLPAAPSMSQFMPMIGGSAPMAGPEAFSGSANLLAFSFQNGAGTQNSNTCLMLRFEPDGTIQQITGCPVAPLNSLPLPLANGVIYIARPDSTGNPLTASIRAITIWGATGRIRGYRLNVSSPSCGSASGNCTWVPY